MKDRVINDSVNRITQHYKAGVHRGVDLGWRSEEWQNEVHPNCVGEVYQTLDHIPHGSEKGGGWGNYVLIKHPNGMFSRYAHLQDNLKVKKGDRVDENTIIGIIGNTGRSTARHLHFEVQTTSNSNSRINPEPYLTKAIYDGNGRVERIKSIQRILNSRYNTNLVIDGIYGKETKKAFIIGLQKELNKQYNAGLIVDGIWGVKTKRACPIVRIGASGNITWLIQAHLYTPYYYDLVIDGSYGKNTYNAVKDFQSKHGLIADGICGKNTFERIFN